MRHKAIVDALVKTARETMPPAEAGRFEAEVVRVFRVRARRDPKDLEREHLLTRHCPSQLPPITLDRPTKPLAARRRRRHTWAKKKATQLLLPF